jgi:hypothetical protein
MTEKVCLGTATFNPEVRHVVRGWPLEYPLNLWPHIVPPDTSSILELGNVSPESIHALVGRVLIGW